MQAVSANLANYLAIGQVVVANNQSITPYGTTRHGLGTSRWLTRILIAIGNPRFGNALATSKEKRRDGATSWRNEHDENKSEDVQGDLSLSRQFGRKE